MSNSGKPCLPHGWIVKQSKTYPDRVYYFNTLTGTTTWEMPQLIKPKLPDALRLLESEANFSPASFSTSQDEPDSLDLNSYTERASTSSMGSKLSKKKDVKPRLADTKPVVETLSAASNVSGGSSIENSYQQITGTVKQQGNKSANVGNSIPHKKDSSVTPRTSNSSSKRPVLSQSDIGNVKKQDLIVTKPVSFTKISPPKDFVNSLLPQYSFTSFTSPTKRKWEKTSQSSSTKADSSSVHSKKLKTSNIGKVTKQQKTVIKEEHRSNTCEVPEHLIISITDSKSRKVVSSSVGSVDKTGTAPNVIKPVLCDKTLEEKSEEVDDIEKQKSIQSWIDQCEPEENLSECSSILHHPSSRGTMMAPASPDSGILINDSRKVVNKEKQTCRMTPDSGHSSLMGDTGISTDIWKNPRSFCQPQSKSSVPKSTNFWRGVHSKAGGAIAESREITSMEIDEFQSDLDSLEDRPIEAMDVSDIALKEVRTHMEKRPNDVIGQLTGTVSDASWVPETNTDRALLIVVDTNVLMHNLGFVEDLRDQEFQGLGRPTLIIPWVVMQELDALKNNKKNIHTLSMTTALKARAPVNFLHNCFQLKHPRIVGQSPKQDCESSSEFKRENNDDRILQCCLYFKKKNPGCHTLLLSNDKNLNSKARILGIIAYSKQAVTLGIRKLARISKTSKATTTPPPTEQPETLDNSGTYDKVGDDILCKARPLLHDALEVVLRKEMVIAYDDLCTGGKILAEFKSPVSEKTDIVLRKPPWSLEDILDCFKKHWIAVFGHLFKRSLQSSVERLVDKFKPFNKFDRTVAAVGDLLTDAVLLLDDCHSYSKKNNNSYGIKFNEAYEVLKTLLDFSREYENGTTKNVNLDLYLKQRANMLQPETSKTVAAHTDNSPPSQDADFDLAEKQKLESVNTVLERFQHVWVAIDNACTTLEKWVTDNAFDKVTILLQKLVTPTTELLSVFKFILSHDPENLNEDVVCKLTDSINYFFIKLDLEDPMEHVSSEHVLFMLNLTEKRPLLQEGCNQLDSMCIKLKTIITLLPD